MKFAGNVEQKNNTTYSDDGRTQMATMNVGVASKADVIVPELRDLVPFRTFQEVKQPHSQFVFRPSDQGKPALRLWKLRRYLEERGSDGIKEYFRAALCRDAGRDCGRIVIIG